MPAWLSKPDDERVVFESCRFIAQAPQAQPFILWLRQALEYERVQNDQRQDDELKWGQGRCQAVADILKDIRQAGENVEVSAFETRLAGIE